MSDWIYVNDASNQHRYILGEQGTKILFCMGINPSYAEPDTIGKLDPTIRKVKAISEANEFDGWIMMNVYPERNTKFGCVSLEGNQQVHQENLRYIEEILEQHEEIVVWLAFGNHIYHRTYFYEYLSDIYDLIQKKNPKWLAVKINRSGSPTHPLYQKDDAVLQPFDMDDFMKQFKRKKIT